MTPLREWQNFYVIPGSAAGALTGLQFVTAALISEMPLGPDETQVGEVFSTPTIVHFGAVLLLSAVLAMPWHGLAHVSVMWAVAGVTGTAYIAWVAVRMRRQRAYKPVLEDWFFRAILPLSAYAMLAASTIAVRLSVRAALFIVAASGLLLLTVGIHNAWDNVSYLVFERRARARSNPAGKR